VTPLQLAAAEGGPCGGAGQAEQRGDPGEPRAGGGALARLVADLVAAVGRGPRRADLGAPR
jgi:hypothetical protein